MDDRTHTALPENDYQALIQIMHRLYNCKAKSDLKAVFKNSILPFFEAEDSSYAWMDVQMIEDKLIPGQTIDCILIPEKQFSILEKISGYMVSIGETFIQSGRPVIAHDVDIPREKLQEELQNFFRDHPIHTPADLYGNESYLATLVANHRPDNVVVGLHRYAPNDKLWTRREIRLMELLHPTLFSVIKRVAIQEQVKTHKALVAALDQTGAPMALVGEGGRVLYRNAAFSCIVAVESGGVLPPPLRKLLERQANRMNPAKVPESGAPLLAFFPQGQAVYRLDFTQLFQDGNRADPTWILRLHPVDDPYTRLRLNLQKAGLTPREMETAILAGDGLDDVDIAQRLFISPNTLKNHFKSIYRKLDVHSRTQLVANLRSSWKPIAGG
ncbi:DNA-binding CsgD family transcriptional regulator [Nitrospina gracilis]|nr:MULTISPECIES: helix-turn-helix transcriptional regulator [Nitrospina]MCF8722727.1 DNA-binding CsgD family transcriptional regulator [Nitrospina sp. Nb-3]